MLPFTTLIQHHRRSVLAVLGTLMLGTGVEAFGVSPALPDASQWWGRQVLETMDTPLGVSEPTTSNPASLIYQSQLTRRDDSLQTLVKRLGLDDRTAQTFLAHDATSRLLLTGVSDKLASVTRTPEGRLKPLSGGRVDTNSQRISRLVAEQQKGGDRSRLEQPTPRNLEQFGSLTIRSSFYAASDQAGIPDAVAAQAVEAFSGDIDFQRDLKHGARVILVCEAFELDGELLLTGQLPGAEIQNGKDTHQARCLQDAGPTGEFVSLDGASQGRA